MGKNIIVELKHINKRFAKVLANDDVSMVIKEGEVVALFFLFREINLTFTMPQYDILGNRMCLYQGKVLLNHSNSTSHRLFRRANFHLFLINENLSFCGMVKSV